MVHHLSVERTSSLFLCWKVEEDEQNICCFRFPEVASSDMQVVAEKEYGRLARESVLWFSFQHTTTANSQIGPVKPAFPAYSQANGQSAPNNQVSSGNTGIQEKESKKPALITTVSANSRIIHPEEDISLVCGGRCNLKLFSRWRFPSLVSLKPVFIFILLLRGIVCVFCYVLT